MSRQRTITPRLTLYLTDHNLRELTEQAAAANKSPATYARDLVLEAIGGAKAPARQTKRKSKPEADQVVINEPKIEEETMQNCPDCQKAYTDAQLRERDMREKQEELEYARQQLQAAQQLAQRAQEEARNLAHRLEAAQRAQAQRPDIKAILSDPQVAAELPAALDKNQALAVARLHLPNLFEPVKLKI